MAAQKFLGPIDVSKFEIQNFRIQNLSSNITSPVPGLFYYNTDSEAGMVWNGSAWRPVDAAKLTDGSIHISALETNPLARSNHSGTQSSNTISDFDTRVRSSRLDQLSVPTVAVSMNDQKITNLAAPTAGSTDAARIVDVSSAITSHLSTFNHSHGETAYGWGNHSLAGYALSVNLGTASTHAATDFDAAGTASGLLSTHTSTYNHGNIANGQTAYGWGNHALAGYTLSSSLGTAATHAATDFDAAGTASSAISGHTTAYDHTKLHDALTISDSSTLDLSLVGQALSGTVKVQYSITSDSSGLKLSGDSAAPGANKLYGTDSNGVRGWMTQPVGSTNLSVAAKTSTTLDITSDTGTDATLPAATNTDAGLMSAAEHVKLSNVATNATASGDIGDAFATSHLTAYSHGNIANGQTAYGWGNHALAGYALSSSLGTAATHAVTDFDSVGTASGLLTTHTSTYNHANIAHGETAYSWGNHALAGYALSVNLGTASTHAATDFDAAGTASGLLATHNSTYNHANIAHGETAYNWGNHASAGYLTTVTYGTTAGTACQGNDSRLSNARTPTAHASSHSTGQADAIAPNSIGAIAGSGINKVNVGSSEPTSPTAGDLWVDVTGAPTSSYVSKLDVDDVPVNGVTDAPVSSNWAYDHAHDVDINSSSLHHTLGTGANQAAAGNHTHNDLLTLVLRQNRIAKLILSGA